MNQCNREIMMHNCQRNYPQNQYPAYPIHSEKLNYSYPPPPVNDDVSSGQFNNNNQSKSIDGDQGFI